MADEDGHYSFAIWIVLAALGSSAPPTSAEADRRPWDVGGDRRS